MIGINQTMCVNNIYNIQHMYQNLYMLFTNNVICNYCI